jgi:hypothetical protein
VIEMGIAAHDWDSVLQSESANPQVVVGNHNCRRVR